MSAPLEYSSPSPRQHDLALEYAEGSARLIFPTAPRWHTVGEVCAAVVIASIQTLMSVWIVIQHRRIIGIVAAAPSTVPIVLPSVPPIAFIYAAGCLFWWIAALWAIRKDRRWANAVVSVELNEHTLTWSRVSHVARQEKRYEASEIDSIDVRTIRDIFGRRNFYSLRFKRRTGRMLQWRFHSSDPVLADRVLTAFRAVLNSGNDAQTHPHQTRPTTG